MLKQLKGFVLGAGLLAGLNAHAIIISGDQVTAGGKQVALQGLEWLSLDHTAGFSRVDIEDGFTDRFGNSWNAGDWRYASRLETSTLLQSLWGGAPDMWHSSSFDGADWFIGNFQGIQFDSGYGENRINGTSGDEWQTADGALFFFGNTGECVHFAYTCWGQVGTLEYYNGNTEGLFTKPGGLSSTSSNVTSPFLAISDAGSLLVRTVKNPINVSESSGLMLFGLGLIGLIGSRRFRSQ